MFSDRSQASFGAFTFQNVSVSGSLVPLWTSNQVCVWMREKWALTPGTGSSVFKRKKAQRWEAAGCEIKSRGMISNADE